MTNIALRIGETEIEDTFAEAFRMWYARLIVTGESPYWVEAACREFAGFATSVIACDAEAGIERWLAPEATPDGRPGAAVMVFGFSADALAKTVPKRAGQCLMTCPTTAVFDGLPTAADRIPLGNHLRYFGDGFQKSKVIAGRRYWRIPVMDGEFLVEETAGVAKGIGGGSMIVQGESAAVTLAASQAAVAEIDSLAGVITSFPGGVIRSGSKVGARRYRKLRASTNEAFCPTLRGRVNSELHPQANVAYELVIDGEDEPLVAEAMRRGIQAAVQPGIYRITAANYGGKLGKFHFHLREVLA